MAPPVRAAPAHSPPALSPETMATLRALVAAQVGPSWMEWFDMTPGQRAAALAATPSLTSELRETVHMSDAAPMMHPVVRQATIAIVVLEVFIIGNTLGDLVRRIPDAHPHQHLNLLIGPAGVAALAVSQLSARAATKRWLLVVAFALLGSQYFLLLR